MENSLSVQHACHRWAFEPYLTHAVIALSRHDRSGTFAGRATSQLKIGSSQARVLVLAWMCFRQSYEAQQSGKHTIMEQTIVARLYYPPVESQEERNEPRADTYHMQRNNLTHSVSPSLTQTPLLLQTPNSCMSNGLSLESIRNDSNF